MSLLLYGIAASASSAPRSSGLGGRSLRCVSEKSLAAVVSDFDGRSSQPREEFLWDFERVIEELMAQDPILPARFGSVLADESEARAMMRERQEGLVAALDRICGAVELAVHAFWGQDERDHGGGGASEGTAYMLRRLELHRRASRVLDGLRPLEVLARATRSRVLPAPATAVVGSYLVDRGRVAEFGAVVARLDSQLPEIELLCTGPWPPYSFTPGAEP